MPWYLVERYHKDGRREDQKVQAATSLAAQDWVTEQGFVVGGIAECPPPASDDSTGNDDVLTPHEEMMRELRHMSDRLDRIAKCRFVKYPIDTILWAVVFGMIFSTILITIASVMWREANGRSWDSRVQIVMPEGR